VCVAGCFCLFVSVILGRNQFAHRPESSCWCHLVFRLLHLGQKIPPKWRATVKGGNCVCVCLAAAAKPRLGAHSAALLVARWSWISSN